MSAGDWGQLAVSAVVAFVVGYVLVAWARDAREHQKEMDRLEQALMHEGNQIDQRQRRRASDAVKRDP